MTETEAGADVASHQDVAKKVARFWPVVSAVVAVLLVGSLAAIIAFRPKQPFTIDLDWMNAIASLRSPFWNIPALVLNYVGGGVLAKYVVPAVIVVALLVFRRPWATLYYAIAAALSVVAVQLLKNTVGRGRPHEILVRSDFGSFPSGHTANAATTVLVLAIIFARVWVWATGAAYTILMMVSRTYLGAHWLSDIVAGLLLGAGIAILVWAPFAARIESERARPHRPMWSR